MSGKFTKIILTTTLVGPLLGMLAGLALFLLSILIAGLRNSGMASELYRDVPEIVLSSAKWAYPFFGVQSLANGVAFYFIGRDRSALPAWSIAPVIAVVFALCVLVTAIMFADERGPVHGFSLNLTLIVFLSHVFLGLGSWLVARRLWEADGA